MVKIAKDIINTMYFFILVVTTPVLADGWDITQYFQVANNVELEQSGVTNNSLQALNHITSDQPINNATQDVNLTNKSLRLTQKNTVNNSTQAVNLILAEVAQAQQRTSNVANITLRQGSGSGNIQTLNAVISDKSVINLQQQVFAPSASLSFQQSDNSSNNIQAANYLKANTAGMIRQSLSVQNVYFDQSGNNNVQAGNAILIEQNTGVLEQNFTSENVSIDFSLEGNEGSIKVANFIHYKK